MVRCGAVRSCAASLTSVTVMTNPRAPTDVPSTSSISFRLVAPTEGESVGAHDKAGRHNDDTIAPRHDTRAPAMAELVLGQKRYGDCCILFLLPLLIPLYYFYRHHCCFSFYDHYPCALSKATALFLLYYFECMYNHHCCYTVCYRHYHTAKRRTPPAEHGRTEGRG